MARVLTPPRHPSDRHRRARRCGAVLGAVAVVFALGTQPSASAAETPGAPGSQGTVTGLPTTSSAVTVKEPNPDSTFPNLKVTVNQTRNLVNQDISVSWTGGDQTSGANTFNSDYLQIFECWGDPETTTDPKGATDPGPPPSQCEFGGESSTPTTSYPVQSTGFEYSRVLSQSSWSGYSQLEGCSAPPVLPASSCSIPGYDDLYNDAWDGFVIDPFVAVDGTVVGPQADYNFDENPNSPKPFWLDPYFSFDTTNEVDFARTYSGGTGQQLFQVDTGLEAPGLGCGQDIEPVGGGERRLPSAGWWSCPGAQPHRRTQPVSCPTPCRRHRSLPRHGPIGSASLSGSIPWARAARSMRRPRTSRAASWPRRRSPVGSPPVRAVELDLVQLHREQR